jgi:hypothetical protein
VGTVLGADRLTGPPDRTHDRSCGARYPQAAIQRHKNGVKRHLTAIQRHKNGVKRHLTVIAVAR